mgnify:CR=1 FL=1
MSARHQIVHLLHIQRVDEMDAVVAGQILARRLPHHRGQMHGIDQLYVGKGLNDAAQGGHDMGHGRAVVLPLSLIHI